MRIGIVGTGRLGSAVAERLLQEGFEVGVWNRSPDKRHALVGKGAVAHETPAALAAASDVVMVLLTDLAALRSVYFGADGLVTPGEERLFIEMSTLAPSAHLELSRGVHEAGSSYLEFPVVGSRDAALAGQLIGIAAGNPADLQRCRAAVDAICRRIEHVGDIGAAASVKLAVNLPLIVYFEVMAEALRLVGHLDIDPHLMVSILADSAGGPGLLRMKGPVIADALAGAPLPPSQNTVAVFTKDLQIMLSEAAARGQALPVTAAALCEYRAVESGNAGDIDGMRLPALLLKLDSHAPR